MQNLIWFCILCRHIWGLVTYEVQSHTMFGRKFHVSTYDVQTYEVWSHYNTSYVSKWYVSLHTYEFCSQWKASITMLLWWIKFLSSHFIKIKLCGTYTWQESLKGLAQAKIIKKSLILLWLSNMTIWYKHVHRLELQKFFYFFAAHSPVRLDIKAKFPYFLFWHGCPK